MTLAQIEALADGHCLAVLGGFATNAEDALPEGTRTLMLLGPREPGFWPHLTSQPEWDGTPDPVDRWSRRAITDIAATLGATPLFPFGGPPWQPFYQWALRTGRAWESPIRLLVHAEAGLMVSFRGALALPEAIDLPTATRPCDTCAGQPCRTACPVSALGAQGYDLAACHGHLDAPAGKDCLTSGCVARRACPLSLAYARMPQQSAYHMGQFHR
ncbi:hypothetical protein [Rhodobacter ferrooxidans]|uniref:4Fe-4S ferredoxin-type domain-containing protein n=1 Tax=Rhodobacter ferrooxidans TaxID=371731 RepID=C8S4X6_9RHOB|nr:hypothetical protein [Rhodobacter sp. SW2]EEW23933.1 conserved hypothetical protein [Rhodobacter sp. SW2]